MAKRKRKQERIPEVLYRIYRNRAHTLSKTIISLLPQSLPSAKPCHCKGKQCLRCCRDVTSFLLRSDDPNDYRKLLTKSYAVVSENAPPLVPNFGRHWSQQQIVKNTVEMIMRDTKTSLNVICNGYNKCTESSKVMDYLTTSAWKLLHKRIGDHFMVHLLKYVAIFLPLPHGSHHQVSGLPISGLCSNPPRNIPASAFQQSLPDSSANHEPPQKRKKVNDDGSQNFRIDAFAEHLSSCKSSVVSFNCHVGDSHRNHIGKCSRNCQQSNSEVNILGSCISVDNNNNEDGRELVQSLNLGNVNIKKRARTPKWQRHKKRRQLSFAEVTASCFSNTNEKYTAGGHRQAIISSFDNLMVSEKRPASSFCSEENANQWARQVNIGTSFCGNDGDSNLFIGGSEHYEQHGEPMLTLLPSFASTNSFCSSQFANSTPCPLKSLYLTTKDPPNLIDSPTNLKNRVATAMTPHPDNAGQTHHHHSSSHYSFLFHPFGKLLVSLMAPGHVTDKCFCFWMLHTSRKVPSTAEINRHSILYKAYCRSSLFSRNHILNTSKANNTGATSVLADIFGFCDKERISSFPGFRNCHICLKGSKCLYHAILPLIKRLICKSRCCQYKKLMDKHCKIQTLEPVVLGEVEYVGEGSVLCTTLPDKSGVGIQEEHVLPTEKQEYNDNRKQKNHCHESMRLYGQQSKLSGFYCLGSQVVSFVWAVCRSIIPLELLGDPSNWKPLRRNIAKFVNLRKCEKFSLKQCMDGLKMSSVPVLLKKVCPCCFINPASETVENTHNRCQNFNNTIALLKNKLFSCWIYWLFSRIIVPILQANFYVTDVEGGKLEVFYFRKPLWKKLSSGGVACLEEHNYRLLDKKAVLGILKRRSFGFSRVRFLPKENGLRVLANLKASSKLKVPICVPVQQSSYKGHFRQMQRNAEHICRFKPVNVVLRDLSAVLKGLRLKHPEKLGTSVFDYNDVYKKLSPFLISLKRGFTSMPSIYVVICDISKAFDFVNQDKLLSVMKDIMLEDEYLLESSSEVMCTKRTLWVHRQQLLSDQNTSSAAIRASNFVPSHVLHDVWINQVKRKTLRKEELYCDLREHVKGNVLQLDRNFYLQAVGIPQGSTLSTLLCSYYYAHLEKNVIFPFLKKVQEHEVTECQKHSLSGQEIFHKSNATVTGVEPNSSTAPKHVLVRFVDDILFISTSKEQASSFFTRLQRGFRDYNCFINEGKSCTNFDMVHDSGASLNKVYIGVDGVSFLPWSGLLINSCTLEIQADYTRYLNLHLSSTLTVCRQDKPGCHLRKKLCHYMHPKCHPIFFDSNINSAPVVRLNIYQAFLLCSMKFHCYVCDVSSTCSLQAEQHFEMIINSFRYMNRLIKCRMFSRDFGTKARPVLKLKKEEVVWLGLKAYIRVLKKKQPRHSHLLSLLRTELLRFEMVESDSLKYATDDSHSSVFWKLRY